MKKLLALVVILALVLAAIYLFGMLGTAEGQPPAPDGTQAPGATPASGSGSVYYLNFKPEQAEQWQELAKSYTDKTGVPVAVVTAASGAYETTLTSEMEKAEAPTLFQVNGPVGLAKWKRYCADLRDTALYQNLKSDDFALTENGKVLAVAYVIETYGIIYNKTLLEKYCGLENAVIRDASEINGFPVLKAVADDIQARKEELGVSGAFTSAGMDSSSDWRFKTHLANMPVYYEYKAENISASEAIQGAYLDGYQKIWDLYLADATCPPAMIGAKTGEDAASEFALGEAVFYQNGTWAYNDCVSEGLTGDQLGMLPIYIGAPGEENQGLCTGSENYWCVNQSAAPEDIQATKAFLEWVITSDEGRDMLANKMGFVTPFKSFDQSYAADNPLIQAANESIAAGKTSVNWYFSTMPSEAWKNGVGAALLNYAQGSGDWGAVRTAFVDGWAKEYELLNSASTRTW